MTMYSYNPFLRVTPPAGPPIVYDLAAIDRMTVAGHSVFESCAIRLK